MSELDMFIAALNIAGPVERLAWLDKECSGNVPLRQRIDVLLQAFEKAGSLLDNPAIDPAFTTTQPGQGTEPSPNLRPC